MEAQNEACCPKFEVEKWDRRTFNWEGKRFIKTSIPTFLHVPFPPLIGKKVTHLHSLAQKADATIPDKSEALILFRDPSAFRSEIYYAVTKEVEGANNTTLSGSFFAMMFDGPYNNIPSYIKEMEQPLSEMSLAAKDYYVHYAYCNKCAKASGHNYMILFALVDR